MEGAEGGVGLRILFSDFEETLARNTASKTQKCNYAIMQLHNYFFLILSSVYPLKNFLEKAIWGGGFAQIDA